VFPIPGSLGIHIAEDADLLQRQMQILGYTSLLSIQRGLFNRVEIAACFSCGV
jgi:hypothetical protein